ncbi:MAG: hypothetical protein MUO38_02225, partial [Anaerolineales bacterium]|nr:hypothetical protein [Anaerolineales bacterium]
HRFLVARVGCLKQRAANNSAHGCASLLSISGVSGLSGEYQEKAACVDTDSLASALPRRPAAQHDPATDILLMPRPN